QLRKCKKSAQSERALLIASKLGGQANSGSAKIPYRRGCDLGFSITKERPRAQSCPSREDVERRRERFVARRTDQRPGCEHMARARRSAGELRRVRGRDLS